MSLTIVAVWTTSFACFIYRLFPNMQGLGKSLGMLRAAALSLGDTEGTTHEECAGPPTSRMDPIEDFDCKHSSLVKSEPSAPDLRLVTYRP